MNKVEDTSSLATANANSRSAAEDLRDAVKQKTKSFDPSNEGEDKKKLKGEQIGLGKLIFTFTSGSDKCGFVFALLMVSLQGAAMPAFMIAFGGLVDAVGGDVMTGGFDMLNDASTYMVLIGFVTFVVSFLQIAGFSLFAAKNAHHIKIHYFRKCLEKDAGWYDERNAGEMGTRIAKETLSVEKGTGDKIANLVMAYFTLIFGFAGAFYFGWKLALILLAGIPCLAFVGGGMSTVL